MGTGMVASNSQSNVSVMYYLNTAFEYEIRNHIDIEMKRLRTITDPSEHELTELERLTIVRAYMDQRRAELRP